MIYIHERRSGYRAANGTSFGFGNVVETPEPLRYITQDVGVTAAYTGSWGMAHAGLHFNDFKNGFDTFSSTTRSASPTPPTPRPTRPRPRVQRNGPSFGARPCRPTTRR